MVQGNECNFAKRVKELETALANSKLLVGQWEKSFLEQRQQVLHLESVIEKLSDRSA